MDDIKDYVAALNKYYKEKKMNWNDHQEIIAALNSQYPDASVLMTTEAELIEKVTALPNFEGAMPPPADFYSSIVFLWSLKNAVKSVETNPHPTRYENDSAYL